MRVFGNINLRRVRELPIAGEVLVQVGDEVTSDQVVLRSKLLGDLHIIRVAESLGIESSAALKDIVVNLGDSVIPGTVVAKRVGLFGLFSQSVTSSVSGEVEFITESTAHIGVRLPPKDLNVRAFLLGKVVEVIPQYGVVISGRCALLQGVFGVGGERFGRILNLSTKRDSEILLSHLPINCEGAILCGGKHVNSEVLKEAARRGACGFITGSVSSDTLREFLGYEIGVAITGNEPISMSFFITEGFGHLVMNERTLKILHALEGREGAISGATQVRAGSLRPELLVAQALEDYIDEELRNLSVGNSIRVVRSPYFGMIGKIRSLPNEIAVLENGVRARVVKIELSEVSKGSPKEVIVPRANVEVL
jgi:hypothetical protein